MRLSLRARQVSVVTALAVVSTVTLAGVYLTFLLTLGLEEDRARGELLARALFHRARVVVAQADEPEQALRDDPGLRALLESSIAYTDNVTYATIVDPDGFAIAHSFPSLEGSKLEGGESLVALLDQGPLGQLQGVYRDSALEIVEPMLLGDTPFGSIHVGLSPVLIRRSLTSVLRPVVLTVVATLVVGVFVSLLLAQWALKPIHVITAGLNQLGQGASGVRLALPASEDFSDVGESFDAISARLARQAPGNAAQLQSVVEDLEDAVAILDPNGGLLFANTAMTDTLPEVRTATCFVDDSLPTSHPYRRVVADAVGTQQTAGPVTVDVPADPSESGTTTESEVTAHAFRDLAGEFKGVILVSRRGIGWVRSVESTLEASRQLAELSRLLAGVGHEVKNPLNAMAIHLELLRQKLGGESPPWLDETSAHGAVPGLDPREHSEQRPIAAAGKRRAETTASPDVLKHVNVLGKEVRRLDNVIQGFLRFIKPDHLEHAAVDVQDLIDGVIALMQPQMDGTAVTLECRCPSPAPIVVGDQALLGQALLNLAVNAVQAMPDGGLLRFRVLEETEWVKVEVEDTGPGMTPDILTRAFELYYTTKPEGSGMGLSIVFRIMQLHGGTIGVESKVGSGTRVQIKLPRAGHKALKVETTTSTMAKTL